MLNLKKLFFLSIIFISLGVKSQPRVGEMAYDINLKTEKGNILTLASLSGKVVLVDFWASWCGPCRASNKHLVKLYAKYKNKGFEILGVSLDQNNKAWKRAIGKDKLTWPQVIDDRGQEAQTAIDWGVYQIPTTYLINREGVVVGINLEKREFEQTLKELLK